MQALFKGKVLHNFPAWGGQAEQQVRALQHLQAQEEGFIIKRSVINFHLSSEKQSYIWESFSYLVAEECGLEIIHMKQICTTPMWNIYSDLYETSECEK